MREINTFSQQGHIKFFSTFVIRNVLNQHIRMISEGSCDTEDWNKGCKKNQLCVTLIKYI